MENQPNQVEPSREQIEETVKSLVVWLNYQFPTTPGLCRAVARWHLTTTAPLEKTLAVVTGDLQHCQTEHDTLTQQLTAAQVEINNLRADLLEMKGRSVTKLAETALLRSQLAAAQAEIYKYENDEASVCPEDVGFVEYIKRLTAKLATAQTELEKVKSQRNRQGVLIRSEFFAKVESQHARILKLEAMVAHLDAFAGSQSVLLNQVLAQLRNGGGTGHVIAAIDEHLQLRNPGNTLVERVKGLDDILWSARDWIEEEECYCSDSNPQCSRCKILKQINAFATPAPKATQ